MCFANSPTSITSVPEARASVAQRPVLQSSELVNLPTEVLIKILGMLSIKEFGLLNLTCRQFTYLTTNHPLTLLLGQYYPNFRKTDPNQTDLKALKEQYVIHSNITKKVYTSTTLQGIDDTVITLASEGGRLFSGSANGSIQIWDLNTNACTATLEGGNGTISSLALRGQKVISGTDVGIIQIWDINTKTCTAALEGHKDTVLCLALEGQKLYSASRDNTVKIWDLNTNTCTATLQGDNRGFQSIVLDGQRLFSGCDNGIIQVWDLNSNTCIAILQGHNHPVISLALDGQSLFSGSSDKTIKIWDLNTNTCTATLEGHKGHVASIALYGEKLFSGSLDDTIKIWDLSTSTCIATLEEENLSLFSFALGGKKIFSGCYDGVIKSWDFTSSDEAIFREIADLLQNEDPAIVDNAMARFENMPPKAKNSIYAELNEMIALIGDSPGCAEDAFHNRNEESSTPKQRARAILNYLEKRSADQHRLEQN